MEKKKEKMVNMPEAEYRRMKRLEARLLRVKNHLRIAWESIRAMKEEEK